MRCNGTEDRVKDPSKQVPATSTVIPFVSFPGAEIKDLYVLDETEAAAAPLPNPPAKAPSAPKPQAQPQQKAASTNAQQTRPPPAPKPSAPAQQPRVQQPRATATTSVGTGDHLKHMRVRTAAGQAELTENVDTNFDFAAGLTGFNKQEVMASVSADATLATVKDKYKKDDFFDSLSCDVLDRAEGRQTRMAPKEERTRNQDTFGAIAVQNSNNRYGGRGRGRGRGGRGGRGRGRGSSYGGGYVPTSVTA